MQTLFLKLIDLSFAACWVVVAVVLLRFILKKAPKWISRGLWAIVGVRLLLPFSIESRLSLMPAEQISALISNNDEALTSHLGLASVSFKVWAVGAALMLCYAAGNYFCFKHRLRTATPISANIRQSEAVSSPCLFGILKPKIYLPYNIDKNNMPYVLAHEREHLKRHDHLLKLGAFLLLCVYWFNPLLWLSYILLCRDIELACDERVIKNMEKSERRAYSKALVASSTGGGRVAACAPAFGEVGVKERVRDVADYEKPSLIINVLAVAVCVVTAICFLTNPITPNRTVINEFNETERYKQFDEGGYYVVISENHQGFSNRPYREHDWWLFYE